MKHFLFPFLFFGAFCSGIAQTNTPAVIITSGTLTTGSDASLSWTIGESLVESYDGEGMSLLQGFQEVEDFPVAIPEDSFEGQGILVYPTRTRNFVNVIIPGDIHERYTGEWVDMTGKVISVTQLQPDRNEINLEDFSYGMYLLKIIKGTKPVTETKIIKY